MSAHLDFAIHKLMRKGGVQEVIEEHKKLRDRNHPLHSEARPFLRAARKIIMNSAKQDYSGP